jgi:uncharacterized protein (TIGR03083 family)
VGDVGDAYAGCRARIAGLTADLDAAGAAARVPTCPSWTVHDVVAHVAGVVDDALNGRLDGVATDPWTAAQVEARRDRSIPEMLGEWDAQAPGFEGILDQIGDPGRQAVTDVVTHEHDIRTALGAPGSRDSDAVGIGLGFAAFWLVASAADQGVTLRIEADGADAVGPDDAATVLAGDPFTLLRAITGRRSVDQMRELRWAGDREAALAAFTFGPFRPAPAPIAE